MDNLSCNKKYSFPYAYKIVKNKKNIFLRFDFHITDKQACIFLSISLYFRCSGTKKFHFRQLQQAHMTLKLAFMELQVMLINIIILYNKIIMVLHDMVTQYADSAQHMLTAGKLILQVGGSPNNSLSINSCSHIHETLYLEQLLQTCILYFLNTECYDWIVSKADPLVIYINLMWEHGSCSYNSQTNSTYFFMNTDKIVILPPVIQKPLSHWTT